MTTGGTAMSVSRDYLEYVVDQLASFAVVARRMFGGVGLYSQELFFGLIDDDTLYLKVDDTNRDDYTSRGCEPFRPFADVASMSYFRVPPDVLEDADELAAWARKSLHVAAAAAAKPRRTRARKPARKR
jgi:DNA transformation protein and related proteins